MTHFASSFHIICADKQLNENSRIHYGVLSHSPDKSFHHIYHFVNEKMRGIVIDVTGHDFCF